jgi:hypothetical protein
MQPVDRVYTYIFSSGVIPPDRISGMPVLPVACAKTALLVQASAHSSLIEYKYIQLYIMVRHDCGIHALSVLFDAYFSLTKDCNAFCTFLTCTFCFRRDRTSRNRKSTE